MPNNLPATQETPIQSLGWEDSLEKGMATHSNIVAWKIPWTEEPGGLQSMGLKESDTNEPDFIKWDFTEYHFFGTLASCKTIKPGNVHHVFFLLNISKY